MGVPWLCANMVRTLFRKEKSASILERLTRPSIDYYVTVHEKRDLKCTIFAVYGKYNANRVR